MLFHTSKSDSIVVLAPRELEVLVPSPSLPLPRIEQGENAKLRLNRGEQADTWRGGRRGTRAGRYGLCTARTILSGCGEGDVRRGGGEWSR
jgi:hypothetical protein